MNRFSMLSHQAFQERKGTVECHETLVAAIRACVEAQNEAGSVRRQDFRSEPEAELRVSEQSLNNLLASGTEVTGLASERHITNAIPFGNGNVAGSVRDHRAPRLLRNLDTALTAWARQAFEPGEKPVFFSVARYWYPPGSYMGWHTNSRFPGWRLYITYCDEPGKSFFRYRDPLTGEVITSMDTGLDFRLFEVSRVRRLWHAVYSETDRYSLGYMVRPWSPHVALIHTLRPWLQSIRALRYSGG